MTKLKGKDKNRKWDLKLKITEKNNQICGSIGKSNCKVENKKIESKLEV